VKRYPHIFKHLIESEELTDSEIEEVEKARRDEG
jgi:hypothetical protein